MLWRCVPRRRRWRRSWRGRGCSPRPTPSSSASSPRSRRHRRQGESDGRGWWEGIAVSLVGGIYVISARGVVFFRSQESRRLCGVGIEGELFSSPPSMVGPQGAMLRIFLHHSHTTTPGHRPVSSFEGSDQWLGRHQQSIRFPACGRRWSIDTTNHSLTGHSRVAGGGEGRGGGVWRARGIDAPDTGDAARGDAGGGHGVREDCGLADGPGRRPPPP